MNNNIEQMLAKFRELFGDNLDMKVYFAPGRVNLIGEHTDYNGGHVFPCALKIGTYAAVSERDDYKLYAYSFNRDEDLIKIDLENITYKKEQKWTNYVLGVIDALNENGYKITHGFNLVVYGNIPIQSGLSSSASLEVLIGYMLRDLYHFDFDNTKLALMSQYAENHFVGVNCGIMDQFIISNGEENTALLLDTNTLKYEKVKINLGEYKLVIMNTNKPRRLQDSKYNERRKECDEALYILQTKLNVHSLCEVTIEEFEANKDLIQSIDIRKRAKHAISENERTILAKKALDEGDILTFGKLMNESHDSLRDDYCVTGIELDTLVNLARSVEGTIGARMTGAGFGGCAIALVKETELNQFYETVSKGYKETLGLDVTFVDGTIGGGPRQI